ncbi:MAG: glycine--tRNA ligase, partial [Candidatus Methanomethyliaceae archaeon]|nr:glycine--tRNA ligase [Candidatus Methanomethyliaceae archaeon]
EALSNKLIRSEWLAYFMAISQKFVSELGVPENRQMFLEKLPNERAHYSAQTFDQVVMLERWGWIEVSGHAYRTDYDLSRHQAYSGYDLTAFRRFEAPKKEEILIAIPNVNAIAKSAGSNVGKIISKIKNMNAKDLKLALENGPIMIDGIEIKPEFIEFKHESRTTSGEHFIPHVAEPSFGAERLVYVTMEYAYREKEGRVVLSIPRNLAPIKVAVFPLINRDGLREKALEIYELIRAHGIIADFDDDGSIGRRYARADEIGTPLAITIDYRTMEDGTLTLRYRDTWEQIRIPISELIEYLKSFFK